MKSFSFFVFLNALILLAYAQDPTVPATTCEQSFALQGTTCTPCQQALFKHNALDTSFIFTKQEPTDRCLVINIFLYHFIANSSASGPATPAAPAQPDPEKIKAALDQTCADIASNPCSDSDATAAYSEVDKACDAELNQYFPVKGTAQITTPPYNVGFRAETTIELYYSAIPLGTFLCAKTGDEYCVVKSMDASNQTQTSQNPNPISSNPFSNITCDDCTKQAYDEFKGFISSHPLNTPNLQKIFANTTQDIQSVESACPAFVSGGSVSGGPGSSGPGGSKSDGLKLTSEINNYPGIILIGLVGFIYVTFM